MPTKRKMANGMPHAIPIGRSSRWRKTEMRPAIQTGRRKKEAKGPRCDPQKTCLEPGKERNDGRVVDVSKCRVPPTGQVIQLIDVKSEDAVGGQVHGDDENAGTAMQQEGCAT